MGDRLVLLAVLTLLAMSCAVPSATGRSALCPVDACAPEPKLPTAPAAPNLTGPAVPSEDLFAPQPSAEIQTPSVPGPVTIAGANDAVPPSIDTEPLPNALPTPSTGECPAASGLPPVTAHGYGLAATPPCTNRWSVGSKPPGDAADDPSSRLEALEAGRLHSLGSPVETASSAPRMHAAGSDEAELGSERIDLARAPASRISFDAAEPQRFGIGTALASLLLGLLAVLYRRLTRTRVLDHELRRSILGELRGEPGQTVGGLARTFGIHRTAVLHHLEVLCEFGHVAIVRNGKRTRFFVNGDAAMRTPGRPATARERAVASTKLRMPDASSAQISRATGVPASTCRRYLARLNRSHRSPEPPGSFDRPPGTITSP